MAKPERFATGGSIQRRPMSADNVPALLDHGYVIPAGVLSADLSDALNRVAFASDPEYVCPFCARGQCGRCHDVRCTCCQGVPDE